MRLYWFLAFALAWAISVPLVLSTHGVIEAIGIPQGAARLIGFAPMIAAMIAAVISGQLRDLWRRVARLKASPLLYLLALLVPGAFLALSVVASPLLGLAPPQVAFSLDMLPLVAIWFVLAAGEEIGWRGFALPQLVERRGFWPGATILGVVWAIWHYPMLLSSPYIDLSNVKELAYWLGLFTLQIFLGNYLICWLMARSGAVLVPTIFHTAFNTVATVHFAAAVDLVITAAFALTVLLILLFDAEPKFKPAST